FLLAGIRPPRTGLQRSAFHGGAAVRPGHLPVRQFSDGRAGPVSCAGFFHSVPGVLDSAATIVPDAGPGGRCAQSLPPAGGVSRAAGGAGCAVAVLRPAPDWLLRAGHPSRGGSSVRAPFLAPVGTGRRAWHQHSLPLCPPCAFSFCGPAGASGPAGSVATA